MEADEPHSCPRILVIAAHPDDETIGAGGQLGSWRGRVDILHVTDGSPRNPADAHSAGFRTRDEYAAARREELRNALQIAGVAPELARSLGHGDQETSHKLGDLAGDIAVYLRRLRPSVVITHPYEGGHPDHDACAFAVRSAIELERIAGREAPELWEFTSYHAGPEGFESGQFLPGPGGPAVRYRLSPKQAEQKRAMFACFRTQSHVLADFEIGTEAFRRAPEYDFTSPPHPGRLHYENFDWGITGSRWRESAAAALEKLGLTLHATNGT